MFIARVEVGGMGVDVFFSGLDGTVVVNESLPNCRSSPNPKSKEKSSITTGDVAFVGGIAFGTVERMVASAGICSDEVEVTVGGGERERDGEEELCSVCSGVKGAFLLSFSKSIATRCCISFASARF